MIAIPISSHACHDKNPEVALIMSRTFGSLDATESGMIWLPSKS